MINILTMFFPIFHLILTNKFLIEAHPEGWEE